MRKITPVVLAGGSGSRLWPISNVDTPKQFARLLSEQSMFQDTLVRLTSDPMYGEPVIVCSDRHVPLAIAQLAEIGETRATILIETVGRDSGPAVTLAAQFVAETDPNALLLVTPSDHLIDDLEPFHRAVAAGSTAALAGQIVVFGVEASAPETGYGYIRAGAPLGWGDSYAVERFVEKPDRATAERYLAEGGYFWNSGMVMATAAELISAVQRSIAPLALATQRALSRAEPCGRHRLLHEADLAQVQSISFDYAVLETAANVAMTPARFAWSDLGTWASISDASDRDDAGNSSIGAVKLLDSQDVYCRSDGPQVAAIGVKDLVIVASGSSVLVTHKNHSQSVKEIANSF